MRILHDFKYIEEDLFSFIIVLIYIHSNSTVRLHINTTTETRIQSNSCFGSILYDDHGF